VLIVMGNYLRSDATPALSQLQELEALDLFRLKSVIGITTVSIAPHANLPW